MSIFFSSLLLFFLFAVLGVSANFVVKNIKYIASILKIKLFAFGILLGLITTLPELFVGLNAMINEAPALSAGNLLSGIIVTLGLILGVSLLFNRQISTDGRWSVLIPEVAVIFSLILFGLDGNYGLWDGLVMVGLYLGLIFYLYRVNHSFGLSHPDIINKNKVVKAILFSITGIVFVLLASHWIVKITLDLLSYVKISEFAIGALVFAVGTNLPEITIAITSWRKKASQLSLSHLLSSSFTNVLVLGILAVIHPITFNIDSIFWTLAIFFSITMFLFLIFYHSGRKMDRREGLVLISFYVLFLIINFYFLKS